MKGLLLRWLRVAPEPTPPPEAGEGLVMFHPSRRRLLLDRIRWGISQVSAFLGIVFSLAILGTFGSPEGMETFERVRTELEEEFDLDREMNLEVLGIEIGTDIQLLELINWLEFLAIGFFLVQFVVSGVLVKLRWETHWYMVSDRILGIRKGLWSVSEQTMTIANVQNMKIHQGPLQRLFGLSDLVVHTAGGAGGGAEASKGGNDLHVGRFEGLDNAEELRRQIRATLARHRTSGLGDPDDHDHEHEHGGDALEAATAAGLVGSPPDAASADGGMLAEARAFRQATERARRAVESLTGAGPGGRA